MSSDSIKKDSDQSLEEQHRSIKSLGSREVSFLKHLVSNYPHFQSLSPGDQLDRMILVLQSACGYGAVSVRTVDQMKEKLSWQVDFSIESHFAESKYQSEEAKSEQTRYRESFEGAFSLKREYMNVLANEGEDLTENEPIRKKVAKKPDATPTQAQPVPRPKEEPRSSTTSLSAPAMSPQSQTPVEVSEQPASLKTEKAPEVQELLEAGSANAFGFKPWMAFTGVGVIVLIVILAFIIKS